MSSTNKQGFLASLLILATGSTLAQVITLAVLPIITRLYGPEAFGVLSVFVAISTLLINMSSLEFSEVIVICDSKEDADRAGLISSMMVLILASITAILFWTCSEGIGKIFGIDGYSFLLKFLAIAALFGGLRQVYRRWLLREHKTRRIAISEVTMAIADRTFTVILGLFTGGSPAGLVFGRLIGLFFGFLAVLEIKNNRFSGFQPSRDQFGKMAALIKRYKHFPYYSWAKLVNISANQLPVLLLSAFFGPAVAGGFALAKRVLAEPVVLMGSAVAQSYYQYAARQKDTDAVARATSELTMGLIRLIAFPIVIGLTCAPELFPLVFGDTWEATGWYTLILAPMFMVAFVMRPLNRIFNLKEKQREKGIFAVLNIILIVAAISITAQFYDAYIVMMVLSFASAIFVSTRAVWLMRLVEVNIRALVSALAPSFLLTIVAVLTSLFLRLQLDYSGLTLIASSFALLLVYLILIVLRDEHVLTIIRSVKNKS